MAQRGQATDLLARDDDVIDQPDVDSRQARMVRVTIKRG